jgi:arylformamidase
VWIDVSVPIENGMTVWPGDPETRVERVCSLDRGDSANVSAVSMCLHAGTHMDAPLHYFEKGAAIDRLPLDAVIGPARVIAVTDPSAINLAGCDIRTGDRLLFKTSNSAVLTPAAPLAPVASVASAAPGSFPSRDRKGAVSAGKHVALTPAAAEFLAARGVLLVGVDTLSIGPPNEDGDQVHRILLAAGVWIIERLDLSAIEPGDYDLICLPLKIPGADGAPARAALSPRSLAVRSEYAQA